MTYEEVLDRLFKAPYFPKSKASLKDMQVLDRELSHPHHFFPSVHVAGSNGKGSVCWKIASALFHSGLKVGLYTSPHLFSFDERIRINGEPITKEDVVKGMEKIFSLLEDFTKPVSFFELTTLLAFDYFRTQKIEIAIIETGLGGRLDATNVITPLLSIITSISREHVSILGETVEEIAKEKAGIIKPGIPILIGPKATLPVIEEMAFQWRSPLIRLPEIEGFYDAENQMIARAALQELKKHFPILDSAIEKGSAHRPPCRFEEKHGILWDVAHNPDAFRRLFQGIALHYPKKKIRVVLGLSKDKELPVCLEIVAHHAEHIYLVEANVSRAAKGAELAGHLKALGYFHFSFFGNLSQSVRLAHLEACRNQELLVICGSFFIMKEARKVLGLL